MCRVISICNQKGGCSKSTVAENLGIGMARLGKKVLLMDVDPQGSLTASLGFQEPDEIPVTLATIMTNIINEEDFPADEGILHHEEGVDLLPANIELSGLEVSLANTMSREMVLREYVELVRDRYDYIILDCMPSLGVMTINALVAADSVLIPVQAAYLPVKGLQQLIKTITVVKKRLNKGLSIEGILITMVDYRTNYAKDITEMLRQSYGNTIGVMESYIPYSVRVAEASAEGASIYRYTPNCRAAKSFQQLTEEILAEESEAEKTEAGKTEAGKTGADKTKSAETQSAGTEPTGTGSVETESAGAEPEGTFVERTDFAEMAGEGETA